MSLPLSSHLDSQNIRDIVRRHRRTIVLLPMLIVAAGVAVILFWPRTYRSEARIYLRVGRENVTLDPTVNTGETIAVPQADRKDEVKTTLEVLKSPSIAAAVVDRLGEDVVLGHRQADDRTWLDVALTPLRSVADFLQSLDPVSDREAAVNLLQRNLNVNAERESTVVAVRYDATSPQLAQTVCSTVIEVYHDAHMRIHRNEDSSPFFAEQQERLHKQLDEAQGALRLAKNEANLASIDQRQATLEAQFDAVELERLRTEQELATAEARIADLGQQLVKVPERVPGTSRSVPNIGADLLHQQLFELQIKAMDLAARYNETHPLVKTANAQLAKAKEVIAKQAEQRQELSDEANPVHRELLLELNKAQSVVAGAKARETRLATQRDAVLAQLRAANDSQLVLDQLESNTGMARDKYMQYTRALEESRIDKELELDKISNLSIVQPAMLSERPVSPSKKMVAAATFILATAGTLGIVLLSERLQSPVPPSAGSAARPRLERRRLERRLVPETNGA